MKLQGRQPVDEAGGASLRAGFTLIEIMIVVGHHGHHHDDGGSGDVQALAQGADDQAVRDTQEVLQNARARAILQGHVTEVVFHPQTRAFEVSGAAAAAPRQPRVESDDLGALTPPPAAPAHSGLSGRWDESILIEMLDVNLTDTKTPTPRMSGFIPMEHATS